MSDKANQSGFAITLGAIYSTQYSDASANKKFKIVEILDRSIALEEVPPFDILHWYSTEKFYSFLERKILVRVKDGN